MGKVGFTPKSEDVNHILTNTVGLLFCRRKVLLTIMSENKKMNNLKV